MLLILYILTLVGIKLVIFSAKYLIWVLIGLVFIWFLKQSREKQKKVFIFGLFCLPVAYAVAKIISLFYSHLQPFVVENFTPLITHEPDNSFPSDHVLLSAGISAVIYPFHKKVSLAVWFLTVLIGVSRIVAGVHYWIDIFGSVAIAVLVSFLIYHVLLPRFNKRENKSF